MSKEIVMYQWNVHVTGFVDVGYKCGEKKIETDVTVIAINKHDAKKYAIPEACKQNAAFVFARTKIRGRDITKIS